MEDLFSKEIIISYAAEDKHVAHQLRKVLVDWFRMETWVRDFDLDGGQLIASALDEAVSQARWFILILSDNAANSAWVRQEANRATFQAIQGEAFKIIVLKLDSAAIPKHLQHAIKLAEQVSVTPQNDLEAACLNIADHIEKNGPTRPAATVYVDRGQDADRLALSARRSNIVFVIGPAGVGKTAFCRESVSEKLHKRPLLVRLTSGHSADLLARQILDKCHVTQPPVDASEEQLVKQAVVAVDQRSDRFFFVLDSADNSLDVDNLLLPYLEDFLNELIAFPVKAHVFLTITRQQNLSPSLAASADLLRLDRIEDVYIREAIDLWLEGTPSHDTLLKSPELPDLVELAGGFPLAARMIASQLKVDTMPSQLLAPGQKKRFRLRLAAHLLETTDKDLNDLDKVILRTLATVGEPITIQDLLAVHMIDRCGIDQVQDAIGKLSDLLLVQHTGELLYIHQFLATHFATQTQLVGDREAIAKDFGHYSFKKALEFNDTLKETLAKQVQPNYADRSVVQLSSGVLRYAVPAARLLRSVGEVELAERLPIEVTGTLREMVFYFYQEARDYRTALSYAARWLKLNPRDAEIQLYRARCFRNLGSDDDLRQARTILRMLETHASGAPFRARILREKGRVAEAAGEIPEAQYCFEEGIKISPPWSPANHIALALLLLRESEAYSDYWKEQAQVNRAIDLLDEARERGETFDRFHLGTYVNALVRGGRTEEAMPLLKEALDQRPDDPRLNYWFAEVLRKAELYEESLKYSRKAIERGSYKALLTQANTYCSQAIEAQESGRTLRVHALLEESRTALDRFKPEFGNDVEVANVIRAKSYRIESNWEEASRSLLDYSTSVNPYTVYERSKVELHHARQAYAEANPTEALACLRKIDDWLTRVEQFHELPDPLRELRTEVSLMRETITSS